MQEITTAFFGIEKDPSDKKKKSLKNISLSSMQVLHQVTK